ncbi:hypothetical protein GQ37_005865 [Janthinobacterium sp. BJB1]|nr:hypothetical protein CSQ90_06415 [Janthinobacterium sp. BJB303]PJC99828.1 hypothetical protein GQ37_005865 [Janthinobacterium sp. BJB1]
MANAGAFEQWEHKRMGDLAYYLAMEIHCFAKNSPPLECRTINRETPDENMREKELGRQCATQELKRTCELFDDIAAEIEKNDTDKENLNRLHEALRKECAEEKKANYCKKRNELQIVRWKSTFFFDPIYSGDQDDRKKKYTDEKISYGDVVGCVDYFLTPEKMMAGSESSLFKSLNKLKKYPEPKRAIHLYPQQRVDLDLSVANRCFKALWNFEGNRAAHMNHTHFQSELILSQRNMHLLALSLRVSEKNIFGALTANAISDHYLHDSFAPGHITAWRSRLTDVAANAFHDKRNRLGARASIDEKFFAKMNAITIDGLATTITDKLLERADEKNNPYLARSVRNYFLLAEQKDRQETCCTSMSPAEQLLYLRNIAESLVQAKEITLKGDDFLWDDMQKEQRLLLLVTEVRSILDILESSMLQEPDKNGEARVKIVDSFKNNNWFWFEKDKTAGQVVAFIGPSQLTATIGPVKYEVENIPKIYGYERNDPIYGVSIGFDDMLFGDQHNRSTILFERLIFGNANEKRDSLNLALLGGVHASHSPFGNDAGFSLRGAVILPQTETILSIPFRYVRMHEASHKTWKPTIGLRLDQGFSSFATFYLEITHDSATQRDGGIQSGLSIGAGLGFAAPQCRTPGISSLMACR